MTLSKQLGLGFFLVLLIVFLSTMWVNISNTQAYLEQQLSSHSQDTATSLGLAIMPHLGDEAALPIIDTMTNAIFDRGYYQSIVLFDAKGNILVEKTNPSSVDKVPAWFISLFPITTPTSSTELNTGWNIAGRLEVRSNPGFGYIQLWKNATNIFSIITVIFIIGLFFVYALVKMITRPIKDVVSQAQSMSNNHFDKIEHIPNTPELSVFVIAMNTLSSKLSAMFQQISKQSEQYRKLAYSDMLTAVGNRRSFELAFEQLLRDEQHHPHGFLVFVRASSLSSINEHIGINEGDNYLQTLCSEIKQVCAKHLAHFSLYRIAGADFGLILEDIDKGKCQRIVEELGTNFKRIEKSEYTQGTAHIGATEFSYKDAMPSCLERADSALAIAATLPEQWQFSANIALSQSNTQWREQISTLISENHADFAAQPIKSTQMTVEYYEWFARIKNPENTEMMPMSQLIPASLRLDYACELDKMLMTNALQIASVTQDKFALNISRSSLLDAEFQQWLLSHLHLYEKVCERLTLEIPERALINGSDAISVFIKQLKGFGIRITVERFGAQLASIMHLKAIKPDYLKIDGRYVRNIHDEQDNQFFVESLISIAHGLNIKVIAEMVESALESEWLANAGVDFQQGYFIDAPRIVKLDLS
ncbi:EAL domain-containing protein [Glaciecola sp. MH2013]|uniref:bifunctional diguanylate cyclase/phosphodiesterase n=1 Tax=Glaciecola sp. MH2013 TaxID=2785524 RepID=UPI00189EE704|nr:EAL domain-containing protein [Glaciecola sp. MH2013]MBF7074879.1 EAL domain-containing protein [Glaciecola sp. MH2013]